MEEIVISTNKNNKNKQLKPFASIDDYLLSSGKINMIRRGNYAWEPMLNNMGSERISTTIDGMKIFCACTDRMGPVNSHLEIGNLNNITIYTGSSSNPQASNPIEVSIDFHIKKT